MHFLDQDLFIRSQSRTPLNRVAGLPWNQWPDSTGIGGRFALEWVADLEWNEWPVWTGIRNYHTNKTLLPGEDSVEVFPEGADVRPPRGFYSLWRLLCLGLHSFKGEDKCIKGKPCSPTSTSCPIPRREPKTRMSLMSLLLMSCLPSDSCQFEGGWSM